LINKTYTLSPALVKGINHPIVMNHLFSSTSSNPTITHTNTSPLNSPLLIEKAINSKVITNTKDESLIYKS
jgi:hypothetical protein